MRGVPRVHARPRRRATGDHGAALVEAAIILPFLVILVFGIVEIGFLFRSASIVNGASRSGARLAAANYGSATTSAQKSSVLDNVRLSVEEDLKARSGVDTPSVLWIYKANSSGNPPSGDFSSCGSPCVVYTWTVDAANPTGAFEYTSGSWPLPDACGTTHDNVGVFVRVSHAPIGFTNFLGTVTLNEHTVMRLESPVFNTNGCFEQS